MFTTGPELRCNGLIGIGDESIDGNVGLCSLGVVFEFTSRLVDEPSGRWLGRTRGHPYQPRATQAGWMLGARAFD
ncbi:hypothetical protein [Haliangium sp.]|uniref:hypothetical protein n=1 Tax=Haliangium sp. TaxID=2663208 RepID=UPI003D113D4E